MTLIILIFLFIMGFGLLALIASNQWIEIHNANAAYQKNAESDRKKSAHEIAQTCRDLSFIKFRNCVSQKIETYYEDQATVIPPEIKGI